MASRRKKSRFVVKHGKNLLQDLERASHSDVATEAIDGLLNGVQLQFSQSRKDFVENLTSNLTCKESLEKCLQWMARQFLRIYEECMKGKWFGVFEQKWMEHIHGYFTVSDQTEENSYSHWQTVIMKCKCKVKINEQRIVISTLAYLVYDLMTEKVKDYKIKLTETPEECSPDTDSTFMDSSVNLYRYGGFALHSLLKRYYQDTRNPHNINLLALLKKLKIKEEKWADLPHGVNELRQGGLDMISPKMLPFLGALVEKVRSLVNEEQCRSRGKLMIKHAYDEIESDHQLAELFLKYANKLGLDPASSFTCKITIICQRKYFMHELMNT